MMTFSCLTLVIVLMFRAASCLLALCLLTLLVTTACWPYVTVTTWMLTWRQIVSMLRLWLMFLVFLRVKM